jgi:hypothetical protein
MSDKSIQDLVQGIIVSFGGREPYVQELARPFFDQLIKDFRIAGFQEQLDNPRWHRATASRSRPKLEAGIIPLAMGFGIFVGASIGSWAVGKVCDDLWDKTRNAFRDLRKKFKGNSDNSGGATRIQFSLEVHYANDSLSVIVEGIADTPTELDEIEQLIPEAQMRALSWITQHGITAEVMRYTIRNGELGEFPKLSDA